MSIVVNHQQNFPKLDKKKRLVQYFESQLNHLQFYIVKQDEKIYQALSTQNTLRAEIHAEKQKYQELEKERVKDKKQFDELISAMETSKDKKITYVQESPNVKLTETIEQLKERIGELEEQLEEEKNKNLPDMDPDDAIKAHLQYMVREGEARLAEKKYEIRFLEKQLESQQNQIHPPQNKLEERLNIARAELAFANEQIGMIIENNERAREQERKQEKEEYEAKLRELKDMLIARDEEIWELKNKGN
ncbi:hypothetical protein CRE_24174 [Caenorhabditis remanei]|uniref:Uncharacterized protein n=1 Tax=Caenorhabditis remanei TaxID=31234 RepID=E3N973_CAERE|nr:hypothetical protein CRE_24174 [Caenorhabditis remanei]